MKITHGVHMQFLKCQIPLPITHDSVQLLSTSLSTAEIAVEIVTLPGHDTAPLETCMWSKSGWHIKTTSPNSPSPLTKSTLGYNRVLNSWRMLVPMKSSYHFAVETVESCSFHRAKTRVRQAGADFKEAHTFRATLLKFCTLVVCLPYSGLSSDL